MPIADEADARPDARVERGVTLEARSATGTWTFPDPDVGSGIWRANYCGVCLEVRDSSEFPTSHPSVLCGGHAFSTCRDCIRNWVESLQPVLALQSIRCLQCHASLSYSESKALYLEYGGPQLAEQFDDAVTRCYLNSQPEFQWCLAPGCGSGQLVTNTDSPDIFTCHACEAQHCTQHRVPWHEGQTCKQYEKLLKKPARDEERSRRFINATSNPCPKCDRLIYKDGGCFQVRCICGRWHFYPSMKLRLRKTVLWQRTGVLKLVKGAWVALKEKKRSLTGP